MNFTTCIPSDRHQKATDQLQCELPSLMVLWHFLVPRCIKNQEYKNEITLLTTRRNSNKMLNATNFNQITRKMFSYPAAKTQFMRQKKGTAFDLKSTRKFPRLEPAPQMIRIVFLFLFCLFCFVNHS